MTNRQARRAESNSNELVIHNINEHNLVSVLYFFLTFHWEVKFKIQQFFLLIIIKMQHKISLLTSLFKGFFILFFINNCYIC